MKSGALQNWCFGKRTLDNVIPVQISLTLGSVVGEEKSGDFLCYIQSDIKTPEDVREQWPNFFANFLKNTNVRRYYKRPRMQEKSKKEGLMSQLRRRLFFSFELIIGTHHYCIATSSLAAGTHIHKKFTLHWLHHQEILHQFVQSAVNVRRHEYENSKSNVVAEIMKKLGKCSYRYDFRDRNRYSITRRMKHKKRPSAISY